MLSIFITEKARKYLKMIIEYKGLRYIQLSISSPIQNSSGIITLLLLFIIFKEALDILDIIGIIVIGIGVATLSYFESNEESKKEKLNKQEYIAVSIVLLGIILLGVSEGLGE